MSWNVPEIHLQCLFIHSIGDDAQFEMDIWREFIYKDDSNS